MKKKIAVLFGGRSPEYEVSLRSAYSVLCAIDNTRYEPVMLGITRQGDWFCYEGELAKIPNDTWHNAADCTPVVAAFGQSRALFKRGGDALRPLHIDAAFPVLHGRNGEDGTVQGVFALMGIPVVGCGMTASALCMDKDKAHRLAQTAGVAVPRSCVVTTDLAPALALAKEVGWPLFVKPVGAGSSFGITPVTAPKMLPAAVELALAYDDAVIVEDAIRGVELGCAVLGNEELIVGEPDEIELSGGFFDYEEKYTLKTSAIHVPARIDAATAERVKETAKTIYRVLGCRGFARVDLFLTDEGRLVFNEVNTIPGFTEHSRFPKMLKAVGLSFEQVVSTAIELAVGGQ